MLINLTCASGIGACEAVSVTVPERDPLETWAFRLTHKILENANRPTTRRIIELRYSDREKPIPGQEITFPGRQNPPLHYNHQLNQHAVFRLKKELARPNR